MRTKANVKTGQVIRDVPHSENGNNVGAPRYLEVLEGTGGFYGDAQVREIPYSETKGREVVDYLGRKAE